MIWSLTRSQKDDDLIIDSLPKGRWSDLWLATKRTMVWSLTCYEKDDDLIFDAEKAFGATCPCRYEKNQRRFVSGDPSVSVRLLWSLVQCYRLTARIVLERDVVIGTFTNSVLTNRLRIFTDSTQVCWGRTDSRSISRQAAVMCDFLLCRICKASAYKMMCNWEWKQSCPSLCSQDPPPPTHTPSPNPPPPPP